MLYDDNIEISEGIDVAKNSNSKECMICHYQLFNHRLKFQNSVCNGSHDLRMLTLSINDIGIITVKRVDCRYLIHDISNTEAIYLLKIAVLDDRGYI